MNYEVKVKHWVDDLDQPVESAELIFFDESGNRTYLVERMCGVTCIISNGRWHTENLIRQRTINIPEIEEHRVEYLTCLKVFKKLMRLGAFI